MVLWFLPRVVEGFGQSARVWAAVDSCNPFRNATARVEIIAAIQRIG
jgi:hypothetical protein